MTMWRRIDRDNRAPIIYKESKALRLGASLPELAEPAQSFWVRAGSISVSTIFHAHPQPFTPA
jgi:hypothetical protein